MNLDSGSKPPQKGQRTNQRHCKERPHHVDNEDEQGKKTALKLPMGMTRTGGWEEKVVGADYHRCAFHALSSRS